MTKKVNQQEKALHAEPVRNRKRKQFTLSDISRERLDYLKKYHGTSESVIVDMAISQFYIHTINEIKPLKDKE